MRGGAGTSRAVPAPASLGATGRCAHALDSAPVRTQRLSTVQFANPRDRRVSKNLRLIASLTSPYVRKVRIVMAEKRIDCQLELEDVPCLIMEDGGAVFDSRVIVEYLDTLTPLAKLIPGNGRERVEVRTWEALADGVLDAAILVRLEQTQRPREQQSQKWIDRQMGKVHAGLAAMSRGLGEKPWCAGQSYTLADIAVGCALAYLDFRFAQIDWRGQYQNLARLYDKLAARPSFIDTAPPKA
jgi:glutathione S-transferase